MGRITRCVFGLVAAVPALAGLGCQGSGPLSVGLINLSTTPVEVEASARSGDRGDLVDGTREQSVRVLSGEERSLVFDNVPPDTAVTVNAGIPGSDALPRVLTLGPPGPYLVEIRGNENGITLRRTEPFRLREDPIPPDPYGQGLNTDRAPVNLTPPGFR